MSEWEAKHSYTLAIVTVITAMLWDITRKAKQKLLGRYNVQTAAKLHTEQCRLDKGGWSPGWTTVVSAPTKKRADELLKKEKKKWIGDSCVKFRIKKA